MILGADQVIDLIQNKVKVVHSTGNILTKPLIEGLDDSQIERIEGTTVDLRLGAIYRPLSGASLKIDERITPEIQCVADISRGDRCYVLKPDEYVLVQTIEEVNLPSNLLAYISNRTTLFRCGIYLQTAFVSPNYQGALTFGMKNVSQHEVEIELGFRIACIAFFEVGGATVPYQGVWQGRRVSTDGERERPF